ncbi:hypothetical protein C2845_PM01G37210 [Panicum miliaceum]|uniref:F-box/LRR-repeat protein 15/At3g58940/PEG3-like LRR domain-containing protein n=1 Tax=Panicum miliaceum TaxID=4540 RepID=A0A3L6TQV8_PANMI|nr:hypothetical protein C2845_PM01G37210 [Panicum miliaceum]
MAEQEDRISLLPDCVRPPLPRILLGRAGASIRHLDLHCCRLGRSNDPCSPVPTLQHLDYLYLSDVIISEMALHRMIEVCPVLRELHLFMIDGLHRIIFHSSTLATMSISSPCVPLDEFSTWDMPALQSVTFSYIDLWRVPVFTINVGNGRLREIGLKLPNLDSPSLNIVANKCFHFCSNNEVGFGDWEPASEAVISQKNKHLTYIRLSGYCGTVGEVDFVSWRIRMVSLPLLAAGEIACIFFVTAGGAHPVGDLSRSSAHLFSPPPAGLRNAGPPAASRQSTASLWDWDTGSQAVPAHRRPLPQARNHQNCALVPACSAPSRARLPPPLVTAASGGPQSCKLAAA